ncbi:hypothetical protein DBV05_g877 [Lasiodiplodia theobromae]|uniref:Uncharacterized protein n=1 Tax=Lasiodiplodia theobromae TaxID=45133 RepID=A0A5N5DUG3_9PEZI|nr:hypothetical protein DBV05_g877 [Lasiodiplodia theobromae]
MTPAFVFPTRDTRTIKATRSLPPLRKSQSFAHIQVIRREDERRPPRNTHSYLSNASTADLSSPSFRRTGSESDITSLRTTLTRDTSSSSVVAPGHTFADMARTGGSKKNEPFAVRPTHSPAGLMKLKPKAKTKSIWKPLDLAENENASASPAPAEEETSQDEVETGSVASSSHILAPIRAPLGPPVDMAGSNAREGKDEVLEEFGHRLAEPVWLRSNPGKQNGELRFIQHPNRDVSAHLWSATDFEWMEIGLYSCARKLIGGPVTHDNYLEFSGLPKRRDVSLAYFTKLAKGYHRFHEIHPAAVVSPLSSKQPAGALQQRPALNPRPTTSEAARYDSLSTVSGSLNEDRFPTLASLTLRDHPAAVPRPIATRGPAAPQGLGAPADDPFATDSQISPKTELSSTPWSGGIREHTMLRDPGKMDFAFRFPSDINSSLRGGLIPSVDGGDRKAFFAEQERTRAEKMRQGFAPTDRSDRADDSQSKTDETPLSEMTQFASRVASDRGPPVPGIGPGASVTSSGPATSMGPLAKIQTNPLDVHQAQQLDQTNESRARMLDYLNRIGNEHVPTLHPPQDLRGLQRSSSVSKDMEATSQLGLHEKPTSSELQVSRTALRTSDPEPGYYENRHSNVHNSFGFGSPTPQNFGGPFFQDDVPTQNNPTAHRSTRKSRADELDEWWKSGLRTQRHDDFMKTLINPAVSGSNKDDYQVTDRLLVPLYESLASYVRVPGEPTKAPDYFARFAPPPEWAMDRSPAGGKSFFGEDCGETPRRIGRDPRYQSNFSLPKFTVFEEQHDESAMRFQQGMRGSQSGQGYANSPFYTRRF